MNTEGPGGRKRITELLWDPPLWPRMTHGAAAGLVLLGRKPNQPKKPQPKRGRTTEGTGGAAEPGGGREGDGEGEQGGPCS